MLKIPLILCLSLLCSIASAKEWTVLMYFSGDNNLSEVMTTQMDILREMDHQSNKINLLLQFDGAKNNDSLRIELGKETKIHQENIEYDMGNEDTLANFVKWGRDNYPADKYALVINGHGRGILNLPVGDGGGSSGLSMASSPDGHAGSVLNEEIMTEKLQEALSGDKLDLFIYSACLMGNLETLITISPIAKYVIASEYLIYLEEDYGPNTVIGEGISLTTLVKTLHENRSTTPLELGRILIRSYESSYKYFKVFDLPGMFHYEKASLVLYNLDNIQKIEKLFAEVIDEIIAEAQNGNYDLDRLYVEILNAPKVNILGYIDLGQFLHITHSLMPTQKTKQLIEFLYNNNQFFEEKTLLYLPEKTLGLSIFFPAERPAYGLSVFESLLNSYGQFKFNAALPMKKLIDLYLNYTDQNSMRIIEEIIIELIYSNNLQNLNERLFFIKMEVYLQKQSKKVVGNYYDKIKDANYNSSYFKKHLKEVEKYL